MCPDIILDGGKKRRAATKKPKTTKRKSTKKPKTTKRKPAKKTGTKAK